MLFLKLLKALVVGYGSIGKRHIENLSKFPSIEIFVLTYRKMDNFLKRKNCITVNSIETVISNKPDFAIITNESSLHVEFANKLAKSGIHLLIEKPLSDSLKGIKTLLTTVERKKLVTLMGYNLRFHPCICKIKELIDKNQIGRIISVFAENGSFLPDWHHNEDFRKSYAARKDLGGGVVLTSSHEIDYLYWFFGDVKEVFSITGKFSNLKIDVEDLSSILMKFKNNVVAEIHLDYFQRPTSRSCKIVGTKGTIHCDFIDNTVKLYDTKKKRWLLKKKLTKYDYNLMYLEELKYFIDCIKGNKNTINSLKDGVKTLEIALAIKKASEIRSLVKLS